MEVVGAAGNVAAGLDLVEHADADVALVDIRLPDGSGIDLTRELLARRPELGVVLYTGDSDVELLYDGLDSGARGYALKAGSMDELTRRDRARRRRAASYVDPRLDRVLLSPRAHRARARSSRPREREIMDLMAEGLTARAHRRRDQRVRRDGAHPRAQRRSASSQARNRVHAIAHRAASAARSRSGRRASRERRLPTATLRELAHDLRTPLTIVAGFAELLARERRELPRDRARVRRAHRRGRGGRSRRARATRLQRRPRRGLRGLDAREERAAAERAVERRPALARRQLLLQPVEGAQAAAEVVDEVHERRLARARHDRRAVLERAVVGRG